MVPIVCIDDIGGILFNNRRVSKDSILKNYIVKLVKGSTLWVREFSKDLFQGTDVKIDDDCLKLAAENDYCFIEDVHLMPYWKHFDRIIICKWNRRYPSDFTLDIDANDEIWEKIVLAEFQGNSHNKITIEEWRKIQL